MVDLALSTAGAVQIYVEKSSLESSTGPTKAVQDHCKAADVDLTGDFVGAAFDDNTIIAADQGPAVSADPASAEAPVGGDAQAAQGRLCVNLASTSTTGAVQDNISAADPDLLDLAEDAFPNTSTEKARARSARGAPRQGNDAGCQEAVDGRRPATHRAQAPMEGDACAGARAHSSCSIASTDSTDSGTSKVVQEQAGSSLASLEKGDQVAPLPSEAIRDQHKNRFSVLNMYSAANSLKVADAQLLHAQQGAPISTSLKGLQEDTGRQQSFTMMSNKRSYASEAGRHVHEDADFGHSLSMMSTGSCTSRFGKLPSNSWKRLEVSDMDDLMTRLMTNTASGSSDKPKNLCLAEAQVSAMGSTCSPPSVARVQFCSSRASIDLANTANPLYPSVQPLGGHATAAAAVRDAVRQAEPVKMVREATCSSTASKHKIQFCSSVVGMGALGSLPLGSLQRGSLQVSQQQQRESPRWAMGTATADARARLDAVGSRPSVGVERCMQGEETKPRQIQFCTSRACLVSTERVAAEGSAADAVLNAIVPEPGFISALEMPDAENGRIRPRSTSDVLLQSISTVGTFRYGIDFSDDDEENDSDDGYLDELVNEFIEVAVDLREQCSEVETCSLGSFASYDIPGSGVAPLSTPKAIRIQYCSSVGGLGLAGSAPIADVHLRTSAHAVGSDAVAAVAWAFTGVVGAFRDLGSTGRVKRQSQIRW